MTVRLETRYIYECTHCENEAIGTEDDAPNEWFTLKTPWGNSPLVLHFCSQRCLYERACQWEDEPIRGKA